MNPILVVILCEGLEFSLEIARIPKDETIWIVVCAEIVWESLFGNGSIEHAAKSSAINITGMNAESDDAPSELIHDDEYPVAV